MDRNLNEFKYSTSICSDKKYQPLKIDLTKNKFTEKYRLGLDSIIVPESWHF